jgi:hypothetical protein
MKHQEDGEVFLPVKTATRTHELVGHCSYSGALMRAGAEAWLLGVHRETQDFGARWRDRASLSAKSRLKWQQKKEPALCRLNNFEI